METPKHDLSQYQPIKLGKFISSEEKILLADGWECVRIYEGTPNKSGDQSKAQADLEIISTAGAECRLIEFCDAGHYGFNKVQLPKESTGIRVWMK